MSPKQKRKSAGNKQALVAGPVNAPLPHAAGADVSMLEDPVVAPGPTPGSGGAQHKRNRRRIAKPMEPAAHQVPTLRLISLPAELHEAVPGTGMCVQPTSDVMYPAPGLLTRSFRFHAEATVLYPSHAVAECSIYIKLHDNAVCGALAKLRDFLNGIPL